MAYNPDYTLTLIVQLNKDIQSCHDIYTTFIREVPGAPAPPRPATEASPANTEIVSTKSQFSTKNPFGSGGPPKPQSVFLPVTPPPSSHRPRTPAFGAQNDDLELDPEFMENLDQAGLQNIAETENLMN